MKASGSYMENMDVTSEKKLTMEDKCMEIHWRFLSSVVKKQETNIEQNGVVSGTV